MMLKRAGHQVQYEMRLCGSIMLLALLANGCRSVSGQNGYARNLSVEPVVVYAEATQNEKPMRFYLKGNYGLVLIHDRTAKSHSGVVYELSSDQAGRILTTQSDSECKNALERLPESAKVDFYDTCTFSLSSQEEKAVLRYCDELGRAGNFYVMCTDFGSTSKPKPWRWKRGNGTQESK
jgi:hypothetical protein